jgi:dipeptidyl aminopeptidase/acylaminoacyl peptidase
LAFVFSSQDHPNEVFLADAPDKLTDAHAITSFNQLFVRRDLPRGVRYRWKADDGSAIEGWLWYPPGKFEAKNLRTLVLIHGGPNDSTSGNCFMLIRSDWGVLAASNDWLVLEPNYRGSVGYGDQFAREVSPNLVSRPGKDILAGVDALVRDGIADPTRLAIGGYSYGGYLTNWLITQTTRFKAAVTGAGAVEHAAEWENDDTPLEGAWLTGGRPWEASKLYQQEAAIFQMDKVKTPTHIVVGDADVRVSPAESYALERALHSLNVPSRLLIFPGEAHAFAKNPWHRKIRYREELRWLEQYVPLGMHFE